MEAEEEQDRAFKQKRMDMLINLKGSITANRVSHDYPGERVNVLCICVSFTCIVVIMVWLLYVSLLWLLYMCNCTCVIACVWLLYFVFFICIWLF